MKTKSLIIAAALCGLASFSRAQDMDSFAPVVVKTIPEAGAKDVAPGEYEVHVTFSKAMTDQSWSWTTAWENSDPQALGKPHYEADHKTCVMKVQLEQGKTYGWWLNSQKFHGFQDTQHHPAVPYLLTFQCATTSQLASPENVTDLATGLPVSQSGNGHVDPATGLPDSMSNGRVDPVTGLPVTKNGTPNLDAKTAVQDWLALVDSSAYPQSWETAAGSFHKAISKDDWIAKLENVRTPLGKLVSRKEISTQSSQAVPGMPRGFYFIAQFETSFAELPNAVETVVFMQESDTHFRAVSYLIRPRTAEQTAAVVAAQKWLARIDTGNYAESWTDASEFFQDAITQDKWIAALESVRKPLGELKIRTVDSAVTQTQMPGAPDGRYVVMQFEAAFAKKNSAIETVTFVLDKGGQWKADGYYIK